MYLDHFGLAVNPFGLSPKLDFLYKSETFEESMAHLIYGLDNQEAIVLITGAIGTGKTMALQSFLVSLGPRFEFALITNTRLTAIELLKMTLEDLGVKFPPGSDKSDLLIMFKDFLLEASNAGKRVLIVVDEAQNLSSEVLEEIRLLTNLGQGESQPVQIILVGQPELEATVNRADLAQLRQRIRVHYNLDPLSRKEIEEYVDHRMKVAGCDRKVFSKEAIDTIFKESRGVPRLVNTMAGEALLSAFVAGHDKVQASDIDSEKDLSFETGPTAAPAPEPELLAPPVAAPVPEPAPLVAPSPAAPVAPEPAPRVEFPARKKSGMGQILWGWGIAAVVVAAIGVLYFTGFLDGLVAAVYPEDPAESRPVVQEVVQPAEQLPEDTPEPEPVAEETTVDAVEADDPDPVPVTVEAETETGPETVVEEEVPAEPESSVMETPVEDAPPAQPQVLEPAAETGAGNIFIHISSFRTSERAESLKRRMSNVGPGIVSLETEVRGDAWYRVYLGPYASREEAYMEAIKFKEDGTISFYRLTEIDEDLLVGQ